MKAQLDSFQIIGTVTLHLYCCYHFSNTGHQTDGAVNHKKGGVTGSEPHDFSSLLRRASFPTTEWEEEVRWSLPSS